MKYFEWKTGNPQKDDIGMEKPCLLWVYDNDVRIGFIDDCLSYWIGGRWVNDEGNPTANHPDFEVNFWCYVPRARNRRAPENMRRTEPKNVTPSTLQK